VGLTKDDFKRIYEDVKVNRALLDACAGPHDFEQHESFSGGMVRSYKCSKCGGVVESLHKFWYERGLEHGRRP
jgi:hypothetical protein